MQSKVWKKWERHWAEFLGGVRVPITGRARGSAPDVEHPVFAIEIKYGNVMSSRLQTAVEQAQAAAEMVVAEGEKLPLVGITHRTGKRKLEHYVLMRAEDFKTWMERKTQT